MNKAINRRSALRTMLYIAAGTLVLPACIRESGRASIALTNLSIDEEDETLLEALAEALIPATDTPGGKELLLHLFVLKMVDDCYSPEQQKTFEQGLSKFAKWSHDRLSRSFWEADRSAQTTLLQGMAEVDDESIKEFFKWTKQRTIQGYMNSKYVMNNLVKYELIPGRYDGYFPMSRNQQ